MVKKVVALETNSWCGITNGQVYTVLGEKEYPGGTCYNISNDFNRNAFVFVYRFKPLEEEMEIKVGSEWGWEEANETLVVKCVGDTSVFYQWISDGSEGCEEIDDFLKSFEPKPTRRTVWLNVYDYGVHVYPTKEKADFCKSKQLLWQQEVELIDPREGERNG